MLTRKRISTRLFRVLTLLFALILMCSMSLTAFAHDVPDISQKGAIRITMRYGEAAVGGGALTLYRVGDVQEENGNFGFVLTDDFAGCHVKLEDIESAELAKILAGYAAEHGLKGFEKSVAPDGTAVFSDLQVGLYLLVQNKAADGYNKADAFLVSVPMLEDGVYIYDVDASPKVELEKTPQPTTPPSETTTPPKTPLKPHLPQTGQLNWPVPVMAMTGMCLFAAGWMMYFGKKKDSYEK